VTIQAKIMLIFAFPNRWESDIGFCRDEAGKPVIPMGVPIASRGTSTCYQAEVFLVSSNP